MNRYLTEDPVLNAQRMLEDLDELYYGACRLHHDHPNNGLGWNGMTEVTKPLSEAAVALMRYYPTIETMTFNRDWFQGREAA